MQSRIIVTLHYDLLHSSTLQNYTLESVRKDTSVLRMANPRFDSIKRIGSNAVQITYTVTPRQAPTRTTVLRIYNGQRDNKDVMREMDTIGLTRLEWTEEPDEDFSYNPPSLHSVKSNPRCNYNDSDWPLYPPARLSLQARLTSTRDSDEWPRNPDASDPARSTSRYYDLLDEKAILQADLSRIQKDKQELTTALSAAQAAQRQHDATCAAQLAQLKSAQSTIATLKGQPAGASMQASTHRAMCAKAREEANSWRERCLGRDEGASDDVPMDASADDPPVEARTGMEELKAELDRERERRIAAETLSQTLQDECQALVASMAELKTGHSLISVFVDAARELNARRAGVES